MKIQFHNSAVVFLVSLATLIIAPSVSRAEESQREAVGEAADGADKATHVDKAIRHLQAAGLTREADRLSQQYLSGESQEGMVPNLHSSVMIHTKLVGISMTRLREQGFDLPLHNLFKSGHDAHEMRQLFRGLRQKGLVQVFAEPTLATTNGRSSSFMVGSTIPVENSTSEENGQSETTLHCGWQCDVAPQLVGEDKIKVEIRFEWRGLETVAHGDPESPRHSQRVIDTSVVMNFGETIALGGLSAHSRHGGKSEESRLLLLVTPERDQVRFAGGKPLRRTNRR